MSDLLLGHCYKIAGRRALVITQYRVDYGNARKGVYIYVQGFTPRKYEQYKKFCTIVENDPEFRTVAQVEGITQPVPTRFRFRQGSKIEEVEL